MHAAGPSGRSRRLRLARGLLLFGCTVGALSSALRASATTTTEPPGDADVVLEAVQVHAAGADAARRHAASATIVIDREALDAMDAATVGELLRRLPGAGLAGDDGDRRGRGRGRDRFAPRILVDGETFPGEGRDGAAALRLPADLIERIEIIRNSTAEHPAGGAGGTINIVLRDAPVAPRANGRVAAGWQGGDGVLRGSAQQGERSGDTGYLLAAAFDSTPVTGTRDTVIERFAAGARSEYRIDRGNDDGRRSSVTLSPRLNHALGERWQLVLSPMLSFADDERSTLTARSTYADPVAATGLQHAGADDERDRQRRVSARLMGEIKGRHGGAESSLRLLAQAEREARDQQRFDQDASGAPVSARTIDNRRSEQELGLVGRSKFAHGEAHLLSVGVEARGKWGDDRRRQFDDIAPGAGDGLTRERLRDDKFVLWGQDEWQFASAHLLTSGLRLTRQDSRVDDGNERIERSELAAEPSLHYLWQASPLWNVRASAARSERAPGLRELSGVVRSASGVNSAINPDRVGNAALQPERTLAVEGGVEYFLPQQRGRMGFSVFHREVDAQVLRITAFETGRWVERPINVGDALLRGAVLDLNIGPDALGIAGLALRGNFAYAHTQYDGATAVLRDESPRRTWNIGIDRHWAAGGITAGAQFSSTARIERRESAALELVQKARRQLDLYVQRKLDPRLSLRLSALNVTRAGRGSVAREFDIDAVPTRIERDAEAGVATLLVSLEGRW